MGDKEEDSADAPLLDAESQTSPTLVERKPRRQGRVQLAIFLTLVICILCFLVVPRYFGTPISSYFNGSTAEQSKSGESGGAAEPVKNARYLFSFGDR